MILRQITVKHPSLIRKEQALPVLCMTQRLILPNTAKASWNLLAQIQRTEPLIGIVQFVLKKHIHIKALRLNRTRLILKAQGCHRRHLSLLMFLTKSGRNITVLPLIQHSELVAMRITAPLMNVLNQETIML